MAEGTETSNVIRVNPEKLTKYAAVMKKQLEEGYKNLYERLFSVIKTNEAQLDDMTKSALLDSCNSIQTEFVKFRSDLEAMLETMEGIGKRFETVDSNAEKQMRNISI